MIITSRRVATPEQTRYWAQFDLNQAKMDLFELQANFQSASQQAIKNAKEDVAVLQVIATKARIAAGV